MNRHLAFVACLAVASLSFGRSASAQLAPAIELPPDLPTVMPAVPPGSYPSTVAPTAAAPYLAPPAWSQTLAPNLRFVILSNFNSDAVLDRETGLVWSRKTVVERNASGARDACSQSVIGNRMGWRLPSIAELQSLMDPSLPMSGQPRLPMGHPFSLSRVQFSYAHWASDTLIIGSDIYRFFVLLDAGTHGAQPISSGSSTLLHGVLCIRGPEVNRPTERLP